MTGQHAQLPGVPVVGLRLRRPPSRPGRWVWARVRGPWLDRELAAGVPSWQSEAHALRAVQLTSSRRRRVLARALERLVADAERPPALVLGAAVRPCRGQVLQAACTLRSIAARLRSRAPVEARGVVVLQALLSDGGGPVYTRGRSGALMTHLDAVSTWLDVQD